MPDRWQPKINTTRRSSGRARTIERVDCLTSARHSAPEWRFVVSVFVPGREQSGNCAGHHFGPPPRCCPHAVRPPIYDSPT